MNAKSRCQQQQQLEQQHTSSSGTYKFFGKSLALLHLVTVLHVGHCSLRF